MEIPSIPNVKFKFKIGTQKNLTTNWKAPLDRLKKNHNIKEPVNERHEVCKATNFNNFSSRAGININNKIPKTGNSNI